MLFIVISYNTFHYVFEMSCQCHLPMAPMPRIDLHMKDGLERPHHSFFTSVGGPNSPYRCPHDEIGGSESG